MTDRILLTGGARSGKSALGQRIALGWGGPVVVVATATAGDEDMATRIARHRAERPSHWTTLEEPTDVVAAISGIDPAAGLIVDCVTLWVSNLHLAGITDLDTRAGALADALCARPGPAVVITNEVGSGVVPPTVLGREYRDVLGRVNTRLAARLDRTVLVAAGRVVELHDPSELFDLGPLEGDEGP